METRENVFQSSSTPLIWSFSNMASVYQEVIVVTGVSTGLGLAMVKWFTSKGHVVLGCARSVEKISQLNDEFCKWNKLKQFAVVDILDEMEVKQWAQDSVSRFGPPTFLLNNAAITANNANVWEISAEEFNNVVDINIKGTMNVIRHFVPHMIKVRKGVVVNFSSGWGRHVSRHVAPYCATKWAIEGLSKAMALELPAPLTCVPLNPGIINTSMLEISFGKRSAAMHQTPDEWAKTTCPFILSIDHAQNGRSLTAP